MSIPPSSGRLRRRGSLDILPGLPLDILGEIFSFIRPTDLLVLARTSKAFRRFLLSRSAAFIWRYARQNVVGLPEPPSDMNEIQYASLVFGFGCHYEGCDRRARDTVWHLRIRSCVRCRPKHQPTTVGTGDQLIICTILSCFPHVLQQYIPCGPFLNHKGKPVKGFQASHLLTFKNELSATPLSERQAYLDRRRQATEIVNRFASVGVEWQLDVKNVRITEMRNKRAARAEMIRESLAATSFREEIDYFGWERIRKHPFISSTQEMTDQARSSVLDQLRDYMLGWRELRMEEQLYGIRRQVFVDAWLRYSTTVFCNAPRNSPHLPLPPSATIGFFQSIDSVIRQSGPIPQELLLQQFYAAFLPVCEYILQWHRKVRRELASLLPGYNAEDSDEAVHAQLKLATSVFQCNAGRNCQGDGRTLTYPEILFHPCFTLVAPENGTSPKDPRIIANQKASLAMGSSPWSCSGRVRVHPKQYVVDRVLLSCGRDPVSTTATEMDTQDPKLVCLVCGTRDGVIKILTWRAAVQHNVMFHSNSTLKHPWFVAKRAPRARIDMLEPPNLQLLSTGLAGSTLRDYSVCLRCPPRIPSWSTRFGFGDLIDHIQKKHSVSCPVLGKDYAFDTNITPL